jgi:hypothetical protein
MFAELPKLFDRNFAIGFFLPFALAAAASLYLLDQSGLSGNILPILQKDLIVGGTVYGLLSWLGGILLLVTNRDLYRILEGYGKLNPSQMLTWLERGHYQRLNTEIEKLDQEYRRHLDANTDFPEHLKTKRNRLMIERVERFPDRENLILPTPFGNTLRAFESYPRIMYGLESIDGWSRLLAIVPSDYRDLIDSAKAQVDFWVNLGFLSLILVIGNLSLFAFYHFLPPLWLMAIIVLVLLISPWRARRLAVEWGDYVKGAFDVFAPQLRETLGLDPPKDRHEEKQQWTRFSQAIIYRLPDILPELKKADEKAKPKNRKRA